MFPYVPDPLVHLELCHRVPGDAAVVLVHLHPHDVEGGREVEGAEEDGPEAAADVEHLGVGGQRGQEAREYVLEAGAGTGVGHKLWIEESYKFFLIV